MTLAAPRSDQNTSPGIRHKVLPGGLSAADHERIVAFAERGWSAYRIAREIEKHPSAVQWFMYAEGLRAPGYRLHAYVRGGRLVKPFDKEEDAFITELRSRGYAPRRIAVIATARYGHPRSTRTIACRLVMLAARED